VLIVSCRFEITVHMEKHGFEVPLLKRAAILTYWWYSKENTSATLSEDGHPSWATVSTVFGVGDETARRLVRRAIGKAKKKAEVHKGPAAADTWKQIAKKLKLLLDAVPVVEITITFDEVLLQLEDVPLLGRKQAIPEGSIESQSLGELALKDKMHWDMPFPEVAKELGMCNTYE
jgi:hypothetical protein